MSPTLLVGLMSGTSVDGIDAALVEFSESNFVLRHTRVSALSDALTASIHKLSHSGDNEIEALGPLDRQLGEAFAQAVLMLLQEAGVDRGEVLAIGCHGQTIRHRPVSADLCSERAFTLQIADPNTIAELTGITTVADFRRRDIAAGGQGAPLAPAFHAAHFACAENHRAIVNIGGIANVSLLAGEPILGFDTGPGNTLLDLWTAQHKGTRFDRNGNWARQGQPDKRLLASMLNHPYLSRQAPKSTGKEMFNAAWLAGELAGIPGISPTDVQATLVEFTARTIVDALQGADSRVDQVFVCGGGAANTTLLTRLGELLQGVHLGTTAELGCDPDWVEAVAFAWLAQRTMAHLTGNLPSVTGAAGPRILGGIYPA